MSKEEIEALITERLVLFYETLVATGQIPLPPKVMSASDLVGCKGADVS